jgi:putative transcriptional regulator
MRDDELEWDVRKAKRNDRDHGVTFELARLVFDDPNAIDRLDLDEPDEDRELITGLVGDVLLTVSFVQRGIANGSSRPERQRTLSRTITTKKTRRGKGRVDESAHGMTPAKWAHLRSKTNDQVLAEARADSGALPVEDREPGSLGPAGRVALAKRIRWALHMSQAEFAKNFRIPLGMLRDWEQHRRAPDQAMQAYLEVIAREPDAVRRALAAQAIEAA